MIEMEQPPGLAQVLNWSDEGGAFLRDKLLFAAMATSVVASPLVAISYRAKGMSVLSRATSVAAAPVIAYALQPASFAASALAPATAADGASEPAAKALPELKSVLSLYHPLNLTKILARNISLQFIREFNKYMQEYLEHEKAAITAEAQGQLPPPAPPMPDMMPAVDRGLATFARELAVATVRRIYEHIAAWRLPARRAQALLRDSKSWIRDVLAVKYRSAPLSRRFVAYQFATLHSSALFYAADCTVAVALHSVRTWRRTDKNRLEYWARGVVLQVGHTATEIAMSIVTGYAVEYLLE